MVDGAGLFEVVQKAVASDCHIISETSPTVYVTTHVTYSNGDSVGVFITVAQNGKFHVSDYGEARHMADLAGRLSHFDKVAPSVVRPGTLN